MYYKYYDEKYANLLVNKCFVNDGIRPLVIVYDEKELTEFAKICYVEAKKVGFKEVIIFDRKSEKINKYIKNTSLENIQMNELLDWSILEFAAEKNSNFLYLETFKIYSDDVEDEKYEKVYKIINSQLTKYYENEYNLKCPWCVACYPTVEWAKKIYPDLPIDKAYEKLYLNIIKMCHVDKEFPEKEWDNIHKKYYEILEKLNELRIRKLYYSNNVGTDLNIYLPDNHLWIGPFCKDYFGNDLITNMPSYEIFTSPLYSETDGIVYSTKPLYYQKIINSFGLEFKKGAISKIITSKDEDYKIIKGMIDAYDGADFLGECAIVELDNPVNKTNSLYYESLYDENASCHLALGNAFSDSIKNGLLMSEQELKQNGLNICEIHVDFMIGTDDLKIEADTKKGKKLIYSNGKFML